MASDLAPLERRDGRLLARVIGDDHEGVVADGPFHDYDVNPAALPGWTGLVTWLRLDPPRRPGDVAEIASVEFLP